MFLRKKNVNNKIVVTGQGHVSCKNFASEHVTVRVVAVVAAPKGPFVVRFIFVGHFGNIRLEIYRLLWCSPRSEFQAFNCRDTRRRQIPWEREKL